MSTLIHCHKLQQDLPAMQRAPYPNALGQKILATISAQAWQMWLKHQTMLINEYRLNMTDAKAKVFLQEEAEKFFFGEGSALPPEAAPDSK